MRYKSLQIRFRSADFLKIGVFFQSLVEETVFLMPEADAAKAVVARVAVIAPGAIAERRAILTVHRGIEIGAVETFVAEFHMFTAEEVERAFGVIGPIGVHALFHKAAAKGLKAAFGVILKITEFAVLAIRLIAIPRLRNRQKQLGELLEKRPGKVECPAILQRIPGVTPKAFVAK